MNKKTKLTEKMLILFLFLLLAAIALFALTAGRYSISVQDISSLIVCKLLGVESGRPAVMETVVFEIRVPRILGAILTGAALSVSGAAYQGIFKNPLVSPDIIGASTGAGFGAALAIILSFSAAGIQGMAFVFSLGAVFATYMIAMKINRGGDPTLVLILTGMLIGTLFSSFISLIKFMADPYEKLPAITFWLMGSLSAVNIHDIRSILIPAAAGFILLFLIRWRLNIMSFGDEEAQALGVNTGRLRLIVVFSSTLLTASVVSITGIIGWVGLLIPHLARMMVGPDYRLLIPVSMLLGSSFLLLVDTLSRMILPMEIPIGILTSIIGAPAFIYLLAKSKRRSFS